MIEMWRRYARYLTTLLISASSVVPAGSMAQALATERPIAILPVQDAYPDVSPDGKHIVFQSNRIGGPFKLFVVNVDGSALRQITFGSSIDVTPAWAPDSRRIVYASAEPVSGAEPIGTIRVVDADGSHDHWVSGDKVTDNSHPRWSPEGSKLVFCSTRGDGHNDDIYVMGEGGSDVRRLTDNGRTWDTFPSFSPDGSKLLFRRLFRPLVGDTLTTNSEIMVMNADGTHAINLTRDPSFDGWPSWSPDGKRVAFSSNRSDAYHIYVMNADGSNAIQITDGPDVEQRPRWYPDGHSIVFNREHDGRIDIARVRVPLP